MRIVVFSSSSVPSNTANSVQVVQMAHAFAVLGHEVLLITRKRKSEEVITDRDIFEHYGVARNFKVCRIPWPGGSLVAALTYALRGCKVVLKFRPSFVLSRNIIASVLLVSFLQQVVHESHSIEGEKSKIWRFAYLNLPKSDKLVGIVSISGNLAQRLTATFKPPGPRVLVAHDGAEVVDLKAATRPMGIAPGPFRVGYAGSFYRGRGIEMIFEIARKAPWARFTLVGNSADVDYYQLASLDNVELFGQVSPGRVRELLQDFDAVIAPYQRDTSDREGTITSEWMSPLKIFEYMASGVPIIASDLPAIREVLEHEASALLVAADNPDDWVDALLALRDDSGLRTRISQQALRTLTAKHTWRGRAKAILRFYEEVQV